MSKRFALTQEEKVSLQLNSDFEILLQKFANNWKITKTGLRENKIRSRVNGYMRL